MRKPAEPRIFAGYVHEMRGPFGSIVSVCCEGPDCEICAKDPEAAKRANNRLHMNTEGERDAG